MRPITWAFDAAVVLGVLLSVAVTSAAPSAAERALNGTTIIDQEAAVASSIETTTTAATTITANPGKSVMSSQSSVKSSISPSLKRPSEFEPSAENARLGDSRKTSSEQKIPPESADDEENMVMSEQDARRLKPNQKKIEQQQHRMNVEKVIDEAQFDYEHYFDSIPSSFSKESEESSKIDEPLERGNPQQIPVPVFEGTDPTVLQKILEFLGLEDFLVDQHLREADKAVNGTFRRNLNTDDDMFIVKSVKVNVRKV